MQLSNNTTDEMVTTEQEWITTDEMVTTEEETSGTSGSENQNSIDIRQLVNNLSHHKLINLKENIKNIVGIELDKTLSITKGKMFNYKGELPSEVQITEGKFDMVLIDKVLRDLLFFNKDLYMKTVIS